MATLVVLIGRRCSQLNRFETATNFPCRSRKTEKMKLRHNEMNFYRARRMFHFTSRLDKRFLQENFLHHLHSHNIKQFYVNFMIAKDKKKQKQSLKGIFSCVCVFYLVRMAPTWADGGGKFFNNNKFVYNLKQHRRRQSTRTFRINRWEAGGERTTWMFGHKTKCFAESR